MSELKESNQSRAITRMNLKRKDPLPQKIVVVVWKDIISRADWVGTISEIKEEMEPILCVSTGWIIEKTKETITIADSFTKDHTFGGVTSIPIAVVVNIFYLDSLSPMKYLNKDPLEEDSE